MSLLVPTNVGLAWVQSLVTMLLVCVTTLLAFGGFRRVLQQIRSGTASQQLRTDHWRQRAAGVLQLVFGHKKVLEEPSYGLMHMGFLYGFFVLGVGHVEQVLFGLTRFVESLGVQPFLYRHLPFVSPGMVHAYELSQDFFAALVVPLALFALVRRMAGWTKRLQPRSHDAETILWLIVLLYVSFFALTASETSLRMQQGQLSAAWHGYLPVSSLLAIALLHRPDVAFALSQLAWWVHVLIFLGFALYIPRSKHMHLLAAGPNIYLRHLRGFTPPATTDFDTATQYGAQLPQDLSWKTLLDTFACTECGRCDAVCPANLTGKPLQPRKILADIKANLRHNWGCKQQEAMPLLQQPSTQATSTQPDQQHATAGQIQLDELWACTTCGACSQVCPVLIDSVPNSIMQLRQRLVLMEGKNYPKEMNPAMQGMQNHANPWGVGQAKRADWAKQLGVRRLDVDGNGNTVGQVNNSGEAHVDHETDAAKEPLQYLFWVGCAGSSDDRTKKVQKALVRILKKAGVDFAILGCKERCTGDPARRMGNEYVYAQLAKENVATLKQHRFRKIFTTCPHCFHALKNEYRAFGGRFSVQHHTELLAELLQDRRIALDVKKQLQETITFHDPCYLGRYNQRVDAPRAVLQQLPGVQTTEMQRCKQNSMCCGAGGGRMFMEESMGKRMNIERADQAKATGAHIVATGCPFCLTMLRDAVQDSPDKQQMQVKDVAELVAERLAD
ncbi:MAG: (Fe-S)-binding protein [Myxococcota bacterium]